MDPSHKGSRQLAQQHTTSFIEVVTGTLSRPRDENVRSLSRLIRAAIHGDFGNQFSREYAQAREQGTIGEDVDTNPDVQATLHDIFEYLETSPPDRITFDFVKRLFFATACAKSATQDDYLRTREMVRIASHLRFPEIATMIACYNNKAYYFHKNSLTEFDGWLSFVVQHSSLQYENIVITAQRKLYDLGLSFEPHRGEINTGELNGLTTLGVAMVEQFIAAKAMPTGAP